MKSYIKQSIFALSALGLLAACSSDANEPSSVNEEVSEGIELIVPSHFFRTRADATIKDFTEDEAKINTLHVLAYNVNATTDADKKPIVQDLSSAIGTSVPAYMDPEYKSVPCRLPKGSYHIYLIANVEDGSLIKDNGTACAFKDLLETELQTSELRDMSMTQDEDLILKEGNRTYLPMSTYYDQLRPGKEGDPFENGVVEIKSAQKTTVYADLIFAVSKIRISIYNTKTQGLVLNDAVINNSITSGGISLGNISILEKAFNHNNIEATSSVTTGEPTGSYYNLPSTWDLSKDPEDWSRVNVTSNGGTLLRNNAMGSSTKAWMWQSIVYVPERLYGSTTQDADKSNITIKFSNGTNSGAKILTGTVDGDTNKGFERGKLYDVIGYVDAKTVTLMVRVKPWQYVKYTYDLEDDDSGSVTPAI